MYSVAVKSPGDCPLLRIGELSRRPGVSDHVLRAREKRSGRTPAETAPDGSMDSGFSERAM
jgi:hypothetical protein